MWVLVLDTMALAVSISGCGSSALMQAQVPWLLV